MKHLNVTFSDDLHKRFKVVCALEEVKMTELIRRLVEEYVEKAEKKQKK